MDGSIIWAADSVTPDNRTSVPATMTQAVNPALVAAYPASSPATGCIPTDSKAAAARAGTTMMDAEENKTLIERLSKVENLNSEEKKLKSEIKSAEEELHLKTKTVIENMTDKDIHHVLIVKWVDPICDGISKLPENLLGVLEKKVKALSEKYADTYEDIENEIAKTQNELIKILDELTGSDTDMAGIMEFKKLLGGE